MSADALAPQEFFEGRLARALVPLSWAYGAAALIRRRWRSKGAVRLERPVISIGNITCGGTGKTPFVEMLARDLLGFGFKPAILSRGYGARREPAGGDVPVNDEFLVLRQNLPEVPHYQGKDRIAIGREAIRQGAGVLILDDGFQHVRLRRDEDIVLIDAISPFGHGRVLPAGLLREPLDALAQATLFGITRSDQVEPRTLSTLRAYLRNRFPRIPRAELSTRPLEWVGLDGSRSPPESLARRKALAFCGIGNPEAFRRQIAGLGLEVAAFVPFRDHHEFSSSDVEKLARAAVECGAHEVVMTQKDAVKIVSSERTAPWRYLRIETRIVRGEDAYRETLRRALSSTHHAT